MFLLRTCTNVLNNQFVISLYQLLYPKDSLSAFSGVSGEILCRGRDYIMWRFTQSRYLVRKDITSVIKLPAEDVKDVLEQMAALKVCRLIIELLFVFVEAVFVDPRSEELGIAA